MALITALNISDIKPRSDLENRLLYVLTRDKCKYIAFYNKTEYALFLLKNKYHVNIPRAFAYEPHDNTERTEKFRQVITDWISQIDSQEFSQDFLSDHYLIAMREHD